MNVRNIARTLLSFFIAGVFLYFAFRSTDLGALWGTLLSADPFWLIMQVPIILAGHIVRAIRWRHLLSGIKPNMSVRNLFAATILGYTVNNVLPRVGEVVRPIVIGRLENVSRSASFGTVIAERVLDFLTFSFLFGITLAAYPSTLDPFVDDPSMARPLFLAGSVLTTVVFFFLFLRMETLARAVERLRARFPGRLSEKLGVLLNSLRSGLDVSHLSQRWGWVVLWSLTMWGIYALGLFAAFYLFPDIEALSLDFGAAMVLLLISTVAWALPAPGAMGTYHSFLPAAMTGLYAVDPVQALSVAIITHEVGFILVMVLGLYFYVVDHARIGSVRDPDVSEERSMT